LKLKHKENTVENKLDGMKWENPLKDFVIDILKDNSYWTKDDEIKAFMNDVLAHWCQSWSISELIYTVDCHKYYDQFYDQIEELRFKYNDELWNPLIFPPEMDMKTAWIWWGFEYIVFEIGNELWII
jgi:hypothetical protein